MRTVVLQGWWAGDMVGEAGSDWSTLMVALRGRPRSLATLCRYDCEKMLSAHVGEREREEEGVSSTYRNLAGA